GPGGGCAYCHANPDTIPATTDCTVCHEGVGTNHHEQHNAVAYNPSGCSGCHFMYLDDEHAALGYTCDTCHESSSETVQGAIDAGNRNCLTCHPDSAHNMRQADEFNAGNASMHRVSPDLPGMRSSFVVDGKTYNWSLPSASATFKSGWTYDSMVTCENCHTYSGATGPHGAAMKVNVDPAYPRPYSQAFLYEDGRNGGFTQDTICAKCHVLASSGNFGNYVHDKHARTESSDSRPSTGRQGNGCTTCHVGIPHGWGRPRLIGYRTDPAPYATSMHGITGLRLRSYSSITSENGWDKSDCGGSGGGCDKHESPISPVWPNVMGGGTTPPPPPPPAPTTGTLTGNVTDASTSAALSGATVSLGNGASTTTASNGGYTLSNVTAGTYSMTVIKTGYENWSGSVSVLAGEVSTKDVALTPTPSGGDNIALGKSFIASRYESSSYSASKAGDGNTSTFWWSDNNGDYDDREWLQVDLASTYSVSSVEIVWRGDYWAREYRIYTSTDNRNWSTAYETSSGSSGTNTISLSPRDARYVRVECRRTGTGRDNGYGIAELRAFGTEVAGGSGGWSGWGH
ncbi:MAG: discoidin domain-containing protein, partial [Coriobacteriia bacterium]|nr:discoidin domain-containing protein [Coriobacteriia bacterium]